MKKKIEYTVLIVGSGLVGQNLWRWLKWRHFPTSSVKIVGRTVKKLNIDGDTVQVEVASDDSFKDMDIVFFAGTEGEKGAAQQYRAVAKAHGCVVIDNGSDFRMSADVPLVIPEINPQALQGDPDFIANPNCSTAIILMAVAPLHRAFRLRRMVATTMQAVSGSGGGGIEDLSMQLSAYGQQVSLPRPLTYPYQIFDNIIPLIGGTNANGESSEEEKIRLETHKILGVEGINISATCVRVPVFNGHSAVVSLEFGRELSQGDAREVLSTAPGVKIIDAPESNQYPMPSLLGGRSTDVFVGRIRKDWGCNNGLTMFLCGDNVAKGAALNAVQIAEFLIGRVPPPVV